MLKQKSINIVEHAEPNLVPIGLFGVFGYPAYFLIWAYVFPQSYESLMLRLLCSIISIPWVIYPYYKNDWKKFFPIYFFLSLFIVLPFFFSFMLLKNEWSVVWTMSMLAGLYLLTLLIFDWLIICLMTVCGFMAAYLMVFFMDGRVSFTYFHPEYIPIFLFSISGGMIANHKRQLADKTKISLLKSLSGSIAHEMRNPLNSITNAIASIHTKLPEKPHSDIFSKSYKISHSGLVSIHHVIEESSNTLKRANKIIDSILTSMQGGEVATKGFIRIPATDAIYAAVNSFPYTDPEEKKIIRVVKLQNFDFLGDRDLFFYVLFNLLKNALYYKSQPDFHIEISSESIPSANFIRIRDTGIGIPKSKRERIFENFYTLNKKEGNGLGLSFCRRVIEAFGGKIVCDSEEGKWAEFTITLPKYDSKKVQDIKTKILKGKRILITDDQISYRLIVSKYLSEMSCQYDLAENGKQAMALLSEKRYDMIFMDFELPLLDGDKVVKFIRSAQNIDPSLAFHYLQVPIIGITSLPEAEATVRGRNCGMNEVLAKPIGKLDIKRIIERFFFSEISFIKSNKEEIIQGKRILLVDDNETSRKFMSLVLKHYDCSIGQAINGRDAINALEQEDFDLVLMDVEMPIMSGIEATKAIRSGEYFNRFSSFKTVPIIGLTGKTDEQSSLNMKEAGMNYHLGKPVFKDELISAMAVMLENYTYQNNTINSQNAEVDTLEPEQNEATFWKAVANEKILDLTTIQNLQEIGGKELIDSLFETFITDCDKLTKELAEADVRKDMKECDKILHTLKGSTGSIGANKMYVLSKYLNEGSHKGKWPENESWMMIFKAVYDETVKELQNMALHGRE